MRLAFFGRVTFLSWLAEQEKYKPRDNVTGIDFYTG